MYEEHFGLKMSPFALGPDPQFIYLTDKVREALAILSYGVSARKGFIQLVGDVGTGKTTLLNIFLDWLRERGHSAAFLCNPHVKPEEFLDLMWADLGLERNVLLKSQMILKFNQWLLDRYNSGHLVVVVVDGPRGGRARTVVMLDVSFWGTVLAATRRRGGRTGGVGASRGRLSQAAAEGTRRRGAPARRGGSGGGGAAGRAGPGRR